MAQLSSWRKLDPRSRRKIRVRKRLSGTSERPRLSVFRSAKHIYAQVIDDVDGRTLAAVSSAKKGFAAADADKKDIARQVGAAIAEACKGKSITAVRFDRNGFLYHGRVKEVAEGAREGGLEL